MHWKGQTNKREGSHRSGGEGPSPLYVSTCWLSHTEDDTLSWHKISHWASAYLNRDGLPKLLLRADFSRAVPPLQGEASWAREAAPRSELGSPRQKRGLTVSPKGAESQGGEEEGIQGAWTRAAGRKTHHAVSSQEVWDHVFVHVVYQPSWTLVVIPTVNEELLPCVLIDKGTDLK